MDKKDNIEDMLTTYFKDKTVPKSIEQTIKQNIAKLEEREQESSKEKTKTHTFYKNLKRVAAVFIIVISLGGVFTAYFINKKQKETLFIAKQEDNLAEEEINLNEEETTTKKGDSILSDTSNSTSETMRKEQYEVGMENSVGDYDQSYNHKDLYKNSDFIAVCRLIKENRSFAKDHFAIKTESEFEVLDVLKGENKNKSILVEYYGGTISLQEYINDQTPEQRIKKGYDKLSKEEIEGKTVKWVGDYNIEFSKKKRYVMFLNYDEKENKYYVTCDPYGIRELSEDGKLYNVDTKAFDIDIKELK